MGTSGWSGSRSLGVVVVLPFALVTMLGGTGFGTGGQDQRAETARATNATYFNDASTPGADPFVLRDESSGQYFAYSTEGADAGYQFAIYRSPDLVTWQRLPGGALDMGDGRQWGHDWFWAPEVYHNTASGLYFLFYSARMRDGIAEHFRYPDFEEASKIGVAVADSPAGPFRNIADDPIDYYPYDPEYHDVNLIMDETQKKPPATLEEGRTAPLGTYLPFIDPNVFFDQGRVYLYFSRNAYRNWVWDHDLGKYVEESNIYAVELTGDWWNDPTGRTMPSIQPRYRDANGAPDDPPGVRKDGFTPILNYGTDKQAWENAHVNDYAETHGEKKDRRWEEGSTTIKATRKDGRPLYFLTYSANNYENRFYGVGYAVSDSPLGPWRKSAANPVLAQSEGKGMYSTGHGGVIASPDGSELYYVHHGRASVATSRRLYTERMHIDADTPSLTIEQSTADEPIPSGVAPYELTTNRSVIDLADGQGRLDWTVRVGSGAAMDLSNLLNRVVAQLDPADAARLDQRPDHATLTGRPSGVAALTLGYQRHRADGTYLDVDDVGRGPVVRTVPVTSCTSRVVARELPSLEVTEGVTCLEGATVTGPVRVAPGATLVAVDTLIDGPVVARGAEAVWLSGGEVAGPVDISDTTGGVRLDGVRIAGTVSLRDNRGSRPVVVADSVVGGSLVCSGNAPEPTDLDRPNTVRGTARGQCADL